MSFRKTFLSAAGAALASLCVLPAAAQDPVFTAESRLVVLHVTVVDKDEQLVTDLTRESFQVFEDDKSQIIKDFKQEDVPVSVGILVDNSGSMRYKRLRVTSAAVEFV